MPSARAAVSRRRLLVTGGAICLLARSPAGAQPRATAFPGRTLRIVVPFTPGGANDVVAREIAAGLQTSLGQTVVVENKPGGGGTIAYSYVAKSPPDGHLMLIAPASFTMGPHLSRNPVYHPVTDFAPINLVADVPFVMVVPASLPARSIEELVALARSAPGRLSFGSVGVGTPQHLGAELFKLRAGVDLVHVPFRGASTVMPDLVAGRIDTFIGAINSLLPLIRDGSLRALAVAKAERVPTLPDVPTLAERGIPGVEIGSAVGLVAPAGTPADIVDLLNREIAAIIAMPGFQQRMAAIGVDAVGTTAEAYARFIRDDFDKWGRVVAAAGIKPE